MWDSVHKHVFGVRVTVCATYVPRLLFIELSNLQGQRIVWLMLYCGLECLFSGQEITCLPSLGLGVELAEIRLTIV